MRISCKILLMLACWMVWEGAIPIRGQAAGALAHAYQLGPVSTSVLKAGRQATARSLDSGMWVWLPVIAVPKGPENPIQTGIATYYDADGRGACSFDASPDDLMFAAMNAGEYENAAYCGAYVHVTGPKGTVIVRIVDLCPECHKGHLDLSREAFAQIADLPQGLVDISWQLISPNLGGPIAYHFKAGSNQWWTAVQIRNHRNPVAKVEYLRGDGAWVNIPRTLYNYFVQTQPGMGPGPYTLRVTDRYGNVLVDSGIPHVEGGTVEGSRQFPAGP